MFGVVLPSPGVNYRPKVREITYEFCRGRIVIEGIIENNSVIVAKDLEKNRLWISSRIEFIPLECFLNCVRLKSAVFEYCSRLVRIEAFAFSGSGLTDLVIPSSVEALGERCFFSCESLLSVTFESQSNLVGIEMEAFSLGRLTDLVIPSSVEALGEGCFYCCISLSSVRFESQSKLVGIEMEAFFFEWIDRSCYSIIG
jgi:hypothetical protein